MESLALVLQVAKSKKEVSTLTRLGLELSQVASLLDEAELRGYLVRTEGRLELSEAGYEYLDRQYSAHKEQWIQPAIEHQIEPIGVEEVFLPDNFPEELTDIEE